MRNSRLFAAHGLEIENAVHLDAENTHPATDEVSYLHLCTLVIPITIQWPDVIPVGYSKRPILGASAPKRSEPMQPSEEPC